LTILCVGIFPHAVPPDMSLLLVMQDECTEVPTRHA
jgi:hypothetical protein